MLLVVNHEVIWRNILQIENLVEKKITTATDKRNTEEKKIKTPPHKTKTPPKDQPSTAHQKKIDIF